MPREEMQIIHCLMRPVYLCWFGDDHHLCICCDDSMERIALDDMRIY